MALVVGAFGGLITSGGLPAYELLHKPPLTPPAAVFPVVWTILYVLMGIGAAQVYGSGDRRSNTALSVYVLQLAANFIWSLLFFGFGWYFVSFLWLLVLWALLLAMIVLFGRIRPSAGLLQIPYLLWVTFAGYLNLAIWLLNR